MGILNITPDSFSDGGELWDEADADRRLTLALRRAEQMQHEGADMLDLGGQSTRPGARSIGLDEERDRILPVLEALQHAVSIPVSVDTSQAAVMTEAAAAGAALINDVSALQEPGALQAAAATGLPVCLMHMQGNPADMQDEPHYRDPVAEIGDWLEQRAQAAEQAGIARDGILLDPGFGFGKTLQHNLALLAQLPQLTARGYPVLVGISRKSMLGAITGRELKERVHASVAAALCAAARGVAVLRVHDVGATVDAIRVWRATEEAA